MEHQAKLQFAFRCYAYPATNAGKKGYYAICIDLNLFTWRPTKEAAQDSLHDAIQGYFETVLDLVGDEDLTYKQFAQRLYRPAPLFPHKARYYAYKFLLRNRRQTFKQPVSSVLTAHAAA